MKGWVVVGPQRLFSTMSNNLSQKIVMGFVSTDKLVKELAEARLVDKPALRGAQEQVLSILTLWWRERALAKALAGLFGACGMLAALMRKARGADATQAG
ncbi:hypothetical protein PGT21_027388 [Puccinia graminis f. sp. tritici]|uniref:Uncharacterized protein n=1 Tax=Puccinia graminis f. sp. tritici TaxID=56615 RepID=A0A5B0QJN6_PUCGR|nr:hypothetical protein PGT21_027388 [Puccinia graminis f. sp. tritici]